jgi:virulence-associated protein VagC
MSDERQVRLFRNGRNQAVRIPVELSYRAMRQSCAETETVW